MSSDLLRKPGDEYVMHGEYHAYLGSTRDVNLVPEGAYFGVISSPSRISSPGSIYRQWTYTVWQAVISRDIRGDLCRMYRITKSEAGVIQQRVLTPKEIAYFEERRRALLDSGLLVAEVLAEVIDIMREAAVVYD